MEDRAVVPFPLPIAGIPPASARLLPVPAALAPLLPEAGLRRGNVLVVDGTGNRNGGATSLLVALVSEAMLGGSWVGVVGLSSLGLEAAAWLGIRLDHLAMVPFPGSRWTEVVGTLVDSLDVVAVVPPDRYRPADARRLAARARERGTVVLVVSGDRRAVFWPEPVDLRLEVGPSTWHGLGSGNGTLERRAMTVRSFGRRAGAKERHVEIWLPDAHGQVLAEPAAS